MATCGLPIRCWLPRRTGGVPSTAGIGTRGWPRSPRTSRSALATGSLSVEDRMRGGGAAHRAGRAALARGAPSAAAELFESAIERTPASDVEPKVRRILEAAPILVQVGERRKARSCWITRWQEARQDCSRRTCSSSYRRHGRRSGGDVRTREVLAEALAEAGDDPGRRSAILLNLEMMERWTSTSPRRSSRRARRCAWRSRRGIRNCSRTP